MLKGLSFKKKVLILFLWYFSPCFSYFFCLFSKLKEKFPLKSQNQLKANKIKVSYFMAQQNIVTFHSAWEGEWKEFYIFLDYLYFITLEPPVLH